jgi:hypothetical protein
MEVTGMNRRHVYILLIALGVLSLVVVGLVFWWSVDPVPPDLVGRWRLVRFVVDAQAHPPHSDNYIVTITSDKPERAPPLGEKHHIGYMAWSDGCNRHWATFSATRAGKIKFTGEHAITSKECIVLAEGILLRPDAAVAYEIRDGELWLYTSYDKSNALVFR